MSTGVGDGRRDFGDCGAERPVGALYLGGEPRRHGSSRNPFAVASFRVDARLSGAVPVGAVGVPAAVAVAIGCGFGVAGALAVIDVNSGRIPNRLVVPSVALVVTINLGLAMVYSAVCLRRPPSRSRSRPVMRCGSLQIGMA